MADKSQSENNAAKKDDCSAGPSRPPTMSFLINTLRDTMTDMLSQISQENRSTICDIVKMIQPNLNSSVRISDVYFPSFDPDKGTDIREWVELVSKSQSEYNLKDHEVRLKAAGVLQGRAKTWADECLLRTTTWEEMKNDMLQTFEPESRYFSEILKFRNYTIENEDSITDYISNVWRMFKRIVKPNVTEQDAVEFVIGSITDDRLRTELLNSKSQSVPELIAIAKTMRKRKSIPSSRDTVPQKKPRNNTNESWKSSAEITCFVCGKKGHRARYCTQNAVAKMLEERKEQKKECSYCSLTGHTSDTCFKKINADKRVNICERGNSLCNILNINIGCRHYEGIFDSGADCSLIKQSIALEIPGKRQDTITYLKGIGSVPVLSLHKISTTCTIDNIIMDIVFFVVLDHEIPKDVLIGKDILSIPGIGVHLTNQTVVFTRNIETRNIMQVKYTDFGEIETDISSKKDLDELTKVLCRYRQSFTEGVSSSRIKTGELVIRLKDKDKVVQRRPYRMAPIERLKVKEILNDLLQKNVIRESNSPFSSPIILVKKKNGQDRLCVDYRELNTNTVRDHYPLPIITDQLDKLKDAKYFTCLDMAAGFHQIPIASESIEKTAFITPDGLFEYLTMPFGLTNAPSVYQRAINKALGNLLDDAALVYIDDVLIPSQNFEDGIKKLEQVISALTIAGFTFNIKKCSFMKTSIEYLGYVVSEGKIRPSPLKIEALSKTVPPKNLKQLRQFNGLAGYFRRFIPNFSTKMIPLYDLTKSGSKWEWNEKHEAVRNKIISYLTSAPLLTIFQEELPIELHTDASSIGLGAILVQIREGCQYVIGYFSMRTTRAESKYHSYELETLSIVRSVKHFRHYLYGRKFTIITDCNAVKASRYKQELLPRIHRWWAFLQNFDFEVEYRKGERLKHADFFSRNPIVMNVRVKDDWLIMEQRRDEDICKIINNLKNDDKLEREYVFNNGILYKKSEDNDKFLKVVPRSFQWSLINSYHESLIHMGWEKTLAKIKENFWFPRMSTIVRYFVDHCVICKTMKGPSGAVQSQLHPIDKIAEPFHTLHIDISGKLSGNASQKEYVFVAIDAYTKFVILNHAKSKTQDNALKHLQEIVFLFGAPKRIIVDGDGAFVSHYKSYCDKYGIELHQCAGYTSRSNGQVERVMRILKSGLTIIKNMNQIHWAKSLYNLQLAINCTISKTTGKSPIELLTGKKGCVPAELISIIDDINERVDPESMRLAVQERMTEAGAKDKIRFDKSKAKVIRFQKGDFVLLKEPLRLGTKLSPKYEGPFEIKKVLPHDRYEIRKINGKGRNRKVTHENLKSAPKFGIQSEVAVSAMDDEVKQYE